MASTEPDRCRICNEACVVSTRDILQEHYPVRHIIPEPRHTAEPIGVDEATLALWFSWQRRDIHERLLDRQKHKAFMDEAEAAQRAQGRMDRNAAWNRHIEELGGGPQW